MRLPMSGTKRLIRRGAIATGTLCALVAAGDPAHASGTLTWPADAVVLTTAGGGFTTSFTVMNGTSTAQTVKPAAVGAGNDCDVKVVAGGRIEPRRHSTVTVSVSAVIGSCDDPTDGTHPLVFVDNDVPVELVVKKNSLPAEDPDPTGLSWPTGEVRMGRGVELVAGKQVDVLTGEFEVVNPTGEAITVQPPALNEACEDTDPAEVMAPFNNSSAAVDPRSTEKIAFLIPDCDDAAVESLAVVASASTVSGKADTAKLTLQAEVNWTGYRDALVASLVTGVVVAVASLAATRFLLIKDKAKRPKRMLGAKLLVDRATPTAWLTAVAALGPLVTALFTTTGLSKALLGVETTPQQGLVLAASAVALLLVGLSGVVANFPLGSTTKDDKPMSCPYAWQFALAAAISASAAYLPLWAVCTAIGRLDVAFIPEHVLGVPSTTLIRWIGAVVIAGYLFASISHYYALFGEKPEAPKTPRKPSAELVAAILSGLLENEPKPIAEQRQDELAHLANALAKKVVAETPQPTPPATPPISSSGNFGLTTFLI